MPSRRRLEPIGVLVAQIVGMGVSFGGQIIQPHLRTRVLIGQRDRCLMYASLSSALPSHDKTVVSGWCEIGDAE
jgi:hypothetical protein